MHPYAYGNITNRGAVINRPQRADLSKAKKESRKSTLFFSVISYYLLLSGNNVCKALAYSIADHGVLSRNGIVNTASCCNVNYSITPWKYAAVSPS